MHSFRTDIEQAAFRPTYPAPFELYLLAVSKGGRSSATHVSTGSTFNILLRNSPQVPRGGSAALREGSTDSVASPYGFVLVTALKEAPSDQGSCFAQACRLS